MTLNVDTLATRRTELRDTYLYSVRTRTFNNYFRLSNSAEKQLATVLTVIDDLGCSVTDFVNAQFHAMPIAFCTRIFGMVYPPFSTFTTDNAKKRYRMYAMDLEIQRAVHHERNDRGVVIKRAEKVWLDSNGKADKIAFALLSGYLQVMGFAHIIVKYELDSVFIGDVIEAMGLGDEMPAFVKSVQQAIEHTKHG